MPAKKPGPEAEHVRTQPGFGPIRVACTVEVGDEIGAIWAYGHHEFVMRDGEAESGALRSAAAVLRIIDEAREKIIEQIGPDVAAAAIEDAERAERNGG